MKIKDFIIIILLLVILFFSFGIYNKVSKKTDLENEKNLQEKILKKESNIILKGEKEKKEDKKKAENFEKITHPLAPFLKTNRGGIIEKEKNFCEQFIEKGFYYKVWSETSPKINKTHIFCGEINSRNKPTGFHSRPNGINPPTAKVTKKEKENNVGVYTSKVEIKDLKENIYKQKFSTFFPDKLSQKQVLKAIEYAWENKKFYKKGKFRGPSGFGFDIEGYTYKGNKNKINTAYPIYKK